MIFNKREGREFKQLGPYALSSVLSQNQFFIHHDIIAPGKKSSRPHFHQDTDEVIYVLSGKVVAKEGDFEQVLEVGDCICFEKNSETPHTLENIFEVKAEVLVVKQHGKKEGVILS